MEESQQLVALQNRIAEKWQQGEVTFGVKGEKEPMSMGASKMTAEEFYENSWHNFIYGPSEAWKFAEAYAAHVLSSQPAAKEPEPR
jgi:hypothetical protein